jgi:phospholipid/cholesterol/gamma-HCH transport system ATP-binding protein
MISDLAQNNEKRTLLISTSNVEIAIRFAKRVIVIKDGLVIADGDWKKLIIEGEEWVKNFLGVRFIGLDLDYAKELDLPQEFIDQHWKS